MYVLQHIKTGKYVARPGSKHSYTTLEHAQTYPTAEAARTASCVESERVVPLAEIFGR